MKKILISQRRDRVAGRDETRDALDVRWAKILFDLGFVPIPVCSELANETNYLTELKPGGILLSGGNDLGEAVERDQLEIQLLNYAKDNKLPVLGICRGMQMINHYCGGSLVSVIGHVVNRQYLMGDWAKGNGYTDVNSYHNLAMTEDTIAEDLNILTTTKDGVVKAIKHKKMPWLGIMWHPEREHILLPTDKQLIAKHLNGL